MMVFTFLASTSCAISHYARNQYVDDHAGCTPDTMTERTDLESGPPPRAIEIFETNGCNMHELYTCSSPQFTRHGRMIGSPCTSRRFCDGAGCDKDYAGVAKVIFVSAATCPLQNVTADFTSKMLPDPPADIASDPSRLKIWKDGQQATLDNASAQGQILVTTKGCGSVGVFACANRFPDAPQCQPLSVTKDAPPAAQTGP